MAEAGTRPTPEARVHERTGATRRTRTGAPLRWLWGTTWRGLVGVIALNAVFFAALTAVYAIPDAPVVKHLVRAIHVEKSYGPDYPADGVGGTNDRYTECIGATSGIVSPDADVSPLRKAIIAPRLSHCSSQKALEAIDAGRPTKEWGAYTRYWNGYAVISRPVIAWSGLQGVRLVSGALLVGALVAAWAAIRRHGGALAATALLTPLVLASNTLESPLAFTQALSIAAGVLGVAIVAVYTRSARTAALAAGVAGAVFNYIDLLTVCGLAWSFAVAAAGAAAWGRGRSARGIAAWSGAATVGWAAGYGLTWNARWIISGIGQGRHGLRGVYSNVFEVGAFRLSGTSGDAVDPRWGVSTMKNLRWWLDTVPTARGVLWCAVLACVVGGVVAVLRHRVEGLLSLLALALPAALVPLWYEAMKNHSQIHRFFVYRSVPAAVGVLAMAAVMAAGRRRGSSAATRRATEAQTPVG